MTFRGRSLLGFLGIQYRFDLAVRNGKYAAGEFVERGCRAYYVPGRNGGTISHTFLDWSVAPMCPPSQPPSNPKYISGNEFPAWQAKRDISREPGIELPLEYARLTATLESGGSVSPEKTYPFLGKMYTGKSVDFEPTAEPFSQYTLSDGTVVRVKTVLVDAVRLDTYTDQGDPVYQFQFQQVLAVIAPETLKRKAH